MLDDIEFDWKLKRPGDKEEWEEMKQELIEFKEQFGHCFIPAAFPRNTRLGQWVSLQRQLYQQSRKKDNSNGLVLPSNLTKGKEKELLDIGLDLTMDNLTFGSMAYETIWMCCTRTVGQKSWRHSRVCKEAAMYQLTTLIFLTTCTSKEGIPSQLVLKDEWTILSRLDFLGIS